MLCFLHRKFKFLWCFVFVVCKGSNGQGEGMRGHIKSRLILTCQRPPIISDSTMNRGEVGNDDLVHFLQIIIVKASKSSSATKANYCTAIMEGELVRNLTACYYPCKALTQSICSVPRCGHTLPAATAHFPLVFFCILFLHRKEHSCVVRILPSRRWLFLSSHRSAAYAAVYGFFVFAVSSPPSLSLHSVTSRFSPHWILYQNKEVHGLASATCWEALRFQASWQEERAWLFCERRVGWLCW